MDVRNFRNSRFLYSYDYLPMTNISLYGFKFFSNSIIPLYPIISGLHYAGEEWKDFWEGYMKNSKMVKI